MTNVALRSSSWRSERLLAAITSFFILLVAAHPAAAQSSIFSIQSSPNPTAQNTLNAVAALSPTDAWAVGYKNDNNLNDSRTLTMHWDGTSWKTVPSPNPGSTPECQGGNTGNVLSAVAPVTPTDVWAVGLFFTCSTLLKPMVLHWNGSAWKAVKTPALRTNDNSAFTGVVALAANNVYAVGYQPASNGAVLTLIEHWNGSAWSVVPSPNGNSTGNVLAAITANSPTDIWAVGDKVAPGVPVETLVEHFDGVKWSVVPSPNVFSTGSQNQNVLMSVKAVSATDVTAAGFVLDANNQRELTMIQHWDGAVWSIVDSPNQSSSPGTLNTLHSITAISSTDMYAAGFFANSASGGQQRTFVVHFDGNEWSIVPTPTRGLAQQLNGIFAIPGGTDVWSVGGFAVNGTDPETGFLIIPKTLVLFSPIG